MILTSQCQLTVLPVFLYHFRDFKPKRISSRITCFTVVSRPGGGEFRSLPLHHWLEHHPVAALMQMLGNCSCHSCSYHCHSCRDLTPTGLVSRHWGSGSACWWSATSHRRMATASLPPSTCCLKASKREHESHPEVHLPGNLGNVDFKSLAFPNRMRGKWKWRDAIQEPIKSFSLLPTFC